jgi:hypothetical protein
MLVCFLLAFTSSCKRRPATLEAIDTIDRRTNLAIGEPIKRDLPEMRARGSLTVLAP